MKIKITKDEKLWLIRTLENLKEDLPDLYANDWLIRHQTIRTEKLIKKLKEK